MISSVEEFILLLKKWSAESARVHLIASFSDPKSTACRGILRLSGALVGIEEQACVFSIGDEEQSAMIGFSGCTIGYGTGEDFQLSSNISQAAMIADLVCLVTASGISICLYTIKDKEES
jgi:hypothetical protein